MKNVSLFVLISILCSLNVKAKDMSSKNSKQMQSLMTRLKVVTSDGGKSGSGGEVWVCRDKANSKKIISTTLRDYKEELILNKSINGGKLSLGTANLSIREKVMIILERLNRYDSSMYQNIIWAIGYLYNPKMSAKEAFKNVLDDVALIKDVPGVVSFVDKLKPQNDANSNIIFDADGCRFEQAAVQASDIEDLGNNPLILIKEDIAKALVTNNQDSFVGLIAHELMILGSEITYQMQLKNTDVIRSLQGKLATNFFSKVSNRFSEDESFEREISRFDSIKSADLTFNGLSLELHPLVTVTRGEMNEGERYVLVGNSYAKFASKSNCSGSNCDDQNRYIKILKSKNEASDFDYFFSSVDFVSDAKGVLKNDYYCKKCIRNDLATEIYLGNATLSISYLNPIGKFSVVSFTNSIFPIRTFDNASNSSSESKQSEIKNWRTQFAYNQSIFFKNGTLLVQKNDNADLSWLSEYKGVGFNKIMIYRTLSPEEKALLNITVEPYNDVGGRYPCNSITNGWKEEIGTEFLTNSEVLLSGKEVCVGHSINE